MKRLKAVLLLLLVFIAGVGVGVVGTRLAVRHFVRQAIANPDFLRQKIAQDLTHRLGLNAEQQAKLRGILGEAQKKLKDLRVEYQPRNTAVFTGAQASLAELLTPEQREKLEKIQAESKELWQPQ